MGKLEKRTEIFLSKISIWAELKMSAFFQLEIIPRQKNWVGPNIHEEEGVQLVFKLDKNVSIEFPGNFISL